MSGRGTQNSPNTRHSDRPPGKPSRLDQFADDLFDDSEEEAEELGVTNKDEAKAMWDQLGKEEDDE